MPYPTRYFRRHNFLNDANNNIDHNASKHDAEFNALVETCNQLNDFIRGITNADGTLRFTQALREMDLVEETRFEATASQTAFTVPEYDTATDRVRAFSDGELIDPDDIELTSATVVTLPAQTLGAIVVIEVFSAGEGVLTRLADDANGEGASLVAIEDAGGLLAATNVEDGLAEVMTALNDLLTDLGTIADYLKADGSVALTGDLPAGDNSVTGLRASVANGEAVRHEQLQAVIAQLAATTSTFLAKAGGTMTGPINMGSQQITALAAGTSGSHAVNLTQVQSLLSAFGGLPVGAISGYGGATAPDGWVMCDGTAYDRTSSTYSALFAVIGTTYGTGGGGNDFQVPDLRGRTLIGSGTGTYSGTVTARARGDKGGRQEVILTVAQMPEHDHDIVYNSDTSSEDSHGLRDGTNGAVTGSTEDTGGGDAHENMMPFNTGNYIIKL